MWPDGKLPYRRGDEPGDYPADNESPNSLFPLINFGWNAQRLPHHFCVYAAESLQCFKLSIQVCLIALRSGNRACKSLKIMPILFGRLLQLIHRSKSIGKILTRLRSFSNERRYSRL
jgi:hypothetical protein